jgi:hypothetical protein
MRQLIDMKINAFFSPPLVPYHILIFCFTDNLFPESENPSRVFVVIIESKAYLGNYEFSPFTFNRSWKVVGGVLDTVQNTVQMENNLLKSNLDDLKNKLSMVVDYIQKKEGRSNNEVESNSDSETDKSSKRRKTKNQKNKLAKKSNNINSQPGSSSLLGRIYNTFQGDPSEADGMSDVMSDHDNEPRASDVCSGLENERLRGDTTHYWITNIELELMSSTLDQFNSRGTEDEAMSDYVRFQKSLNQFNQVLSNGISYEHFLGGAFIAAFDLTTNQQPGLAYAVNTVRTGTSHYNFSLILILSFNFRRYEI